MVESHNLIRIQFFLSKRHVCQDTGKQLQKQSWTVVVRRLLVSNVKMYFGATGNLFSVRDILNQNTYHSNHYSTPSGCTWIKTRDQGCPNLDTFACFRFFSALTYLTLMTMSSQSSLKSPIMRPLLKSGALQLEDNQTMEDADPPEQSLDTPVWTVKWSTDIIL